MGGTEGPLSGGPTLTPVLPHAPDVPVGLGEQKAGRRLSWCHSRGTSAGRGPCSFHLPPPPQAPAPLSVVLVRAGRLKLTRAAGPQPLIPRVWGRPCTSSGFPGGAGTAGQGTTPGRATFVGLRGPLWRHQPCVLQKVKCRQSAAGLAFELYLF